MSKEWLYGKTLSELGEVARQLGMPSFAARQIATWLYSGTVDSIAGMTNISARNRALLEEKFEVGKIPYADVQTSSDGTKKYLFPTLAGKFIESAYIPDRDRATLCVSCQAGCKMGCRFCMTARQGLSHNLTTGEILNQMNSLPERDSLTNIVYMGMGEPLDNIDNVLKSIDILTSDWGYGWSPSRITLSTIGVIPAMRRFLTESKAHLAVSLHNPISSEREELMPVEKAYPIEKVIAEIKSHDIGGQRRVSFEYIMLRGVNDTPAHIKALLRLLSGMRCRVNLIKFHSIPDSTLKGSPEEDMIRFRDALTAKGIITTIRSSRGEDIDAACGLLSTYGKG